MLWMQRRIRINNAGTFFILHEIRCERVAEAAPMNIFIIVI